MSNRADRLNALFQFYINGSITYNEYEELLSLLGTETISQDLSSGLKELWAQSANPPAGLPNKRWDERIEFLLQQLKEDDEAVAPVKKIYNWHKLPWAAAIFLLILSTAIYYLLHTPKSSATYNTVLAKTDTAKGLMPGGNKAILILADGSSIVLDSASNGTIASQGSAKLIKSNTGQLAYHATGEHTKEVLYNTLSTPRGGQYQLVLADGTAVWLNSASSLRYPTFFKGVDRTVEITGEAYFEVAKNPDHPFKVKINVPAGAGGEVEVLGTHFNVNAFGDESTVRTTLFEGSVRVNRSTGSTQLKAGQQLQAGNDGKTAIKNDADLEEVIAWKEGRFQFEDADIQFVMRQIARWYDLEVEYKGNITKHFDGTISKNVPVLKVLNMLELTGEVNFHIEGKKVVVLP